MAIADGTRELTPFQREHIETATVRKEFEEQAENALAGAEIQAAMETQAKLAPAAVEMMTTEEADMMLRAIRASGTVAESLAGQLHTMPTPFLVAFDRECREDGSKKWPRLCEARYELMRRAGAQAKQRNIKLGDVIPILAREMEISERVFYSDAQTHAAFFVEPVNATEIENYTPQSEVNDALRILKEKTFFTYALRTPEPRKAICLMAEKKLAHGRAYSVREALRDANELRAAAGWREESATLAVPGEDAFDEDPFGNTLTRPLATNGDPEAALKAYKEAKQGLASIAPQTANFIHAVYEAATAIAKEQAKGEHVPHTRVVYVDPAGNWVVKHNLSQGETIKTNAMVTVGVNGVHAPRVR
jgi:hypothetical protein